MLYLLSFQEQVILAVDRKAEFPLHVSFSFLVYTPKCDLGPKVQGQEASNSSSSISNAQVEDSDSSNSSNESSDEIGGQDLIGAAPGAIYIDLQNDNIPFL